ncbi:hypothetical protein ACIPV3_05825 [Streptomyces albidoflavus]
MFWNFSSLKRFLSTSEVPKSALSVRYPVKGVPFWLLLRGHILVVTDARVIVIDHNRFHGFPSRVRWEAPVSECAAEVDGDRIRINHTDVDFFLGRWVTASPQRTLDVSNLGDFINNSL